jgi:hypothetical protein
MAKQRVDEDLKVFSDSLGRNAHIAGDGSVAWLFTVR